MADTAIPLPDVPVGTSDKARALAGLSPDERQELLAAAGMLGLAHDDDPFWINQAFVTQLKTLMTLARADAAAAIGLAEEAVEEARNVAKALKPAAERDIEHIKATVKGVQDELTTKAAYEIGRQMRIAYNKHIQENVLKRHGGRQLVMLALVFVGGLVVDHVTGILTILASFISG